MRGSPRRSGCAAFNNPFHRELAVGFVPVILCGGSGTRLWPLSRTEYPKQFLEIGGGSLFADTVRRAMAVPGAASPCIVCNESQRFLAAAALQAMDVPATILLEHQGRNTAPAIALAALAALEQGDGQDGDPQLLVLPSDHLIRPVEAFVRAVQEGLPCAADNRMVTFGVPPSGPETGYGYIRQGLELPHGRTVAAFVEKPDHDRAVQLLSDGDCLWNSGIFLFRAALYLEELAAFAPAIREAVDAMWASRHRDMDFTRFDPALSCPAESIDYAVMEHTRRAAVVPLAAQWSDLGSWDACHAAADKDGDGNACVGDVLLEDVRDSYVHADSRLVAALGVRDLVVVETPDAVLVADRKRSQDVKNVLRRLKEAHRTETDHHAKVYRPWGSYQGLARGPRFQVKRIEVRPGAALSLQLHHHRCEHWVVVSGTAKIIRNGKEILLTEDQSTYIPLGCVHRLENPGRIPLVLIEIQTGSYLGEDDIIRLEDVYGREKDK